MTKLELLAPARNTDIGIAAIRCGADAVYIGGPAFGARVAAWNSVEDIKRLCHEAAPFRVRIYVTVNTLARDDEERRQIVGTMRSMRGIGVSAFILQDTTLLPLLFEEGPWREEFHASTQCAIRTPERAMQLAGMGFTRLILERELSLQQIESIRKAVPECELEFFVHGALCVCYSGDCYLSEKLTGRSANRGECAQPCRSRYDLVSSDGKILCQNKPLLSLKDFNLLDRLEDLASAGIVSFKIEGRLKNESYVKNVVRAYDMALNRLVEKYPDRYIRSSRGVVEGGFTPNLDKTFNRGYTELFISGVRSEGWNSTDAAKGMGEYVGRISKVIPSGVEIDTALILGNGDGLCFVSAKGEVVGFRADKVEGKKVFCKLAEGIRAGLKVWRNRDAAFERRLESDMPERIITLPIDLHFSERLLSATCDGVSLDIPLPESVEMAGNQDRMRQVIENQIYRSSSPYRFIPGSLSSEGPLPFLSAAFLNGVRRSMAACLLDREWQSLSSREISGEADKKTDGFSQVACHPRKEGELMRTKYCIRHQMGMCLKTAEGGKGTDLFLVNNGVRIPLKFDCSRCEMVLLDDKSN